MYPKFEKVDEHTIRIIDEKSDEVKINSLIDNLKQLVEKRDQINKVIANIEEILKNASELEIVPEEKEDK